MYNYKIWTIGLWRCSSNFFYCACVFNLNLSSWMKWSIWKFLLNNGESKYKCSLERTQKNDVYVNPCFFTPFGSNAKPSRINPCKWCIVHATTNWIGNWIFVIVWEGLFPIFISTTLRSIGVKFLSSLGNSSYTWKYFIHVLCPIIMRNCVRQNHITL